MTGATLYVSTFEKSVDTKGRVSVPPQYRVILAQTGFEGLYARTHRREAALECGTQDWLDDMRGLQEGLDLDSPEHDDATYVMVAGADALSWDPEGRVTLPKKFLEHTGISNAAVFAGMRTHFEIWEPKAFAKRVAEAKARMAARAGQSRGARS
jgi:MraZ protein